MHDLEMAVASVGKTQDRDVRLQSMSTPACLPRRKKKTMRASVSTVSTNLPAFVRYTADGYLR